MHNYIIAFIGWAVKWLKKRWLTRKRRQEKKILIRRLKDKKSITFESPNGQWCLFDISTDAAKQRFIEMFMDVLKK